MAPNQATSAVAISTFDESSPRYHCCCSCVHVRIGAFLIGCLHAVGLFSLVFRQSKVIKHLRKKDKDLQALVYVPAVLSSLFFVLNVLAVVCLFVAIFKQRPKCLNPMLCLIIFSMIYYVFWIVMVISAMCAYNDFVVDFMRLQLEYEGRDLDTLPEDRKEFKKTMMFSMLAMVFVFFIGLMFDIWWFKVIKACKVYLEEKSAWYSHHDTYLQARYGAAATNQTGSGGTDNSAFPLMNNQPTILIPQQPPPVTIIPQQPWHASSTDAPMPPPPSYTEVINKKI